MPRKRISSGLAQTLRELQTLMERAETREEFDALKAQRDEVRSRIAQTRAGDLNQRSAAYKQATLSVGYANKKLREAKKNIGKVSDAIDAVANMLKAVDFVLGVLL